MSDCIIALWKPKDRLNVGSIFRAADCLGGVSGIYLHESRARRVLSAPTDAMKAARRIPLLRELPISYETVAVEMVDGATVLPEFKHPRNAIYWFGPEDGNLPERFLCDCDEVAVVRIPGVRCLNLAAAVNVVLYDRLIKCER